MLLLIQLNGITSEGLLFLSGFVLGIAHMKGIKIRWGGDWDGDTKMNDQKFNDLVHFELM